jgi:hypothetical protein
VYQTYAGQQFVVEDASGLPIAGYKLFDRKHDLNSSKKKEHSTSCHIPSNEASNDQASAKRYSVFMVIKDHLGKLSTDNQHRSFNARLSGLSEVEKSLPFSPNYADVIPKNSKLSSGSKKASLNKIYTNHLNFNRHPSIAQSFGVSCSILTAKNPSELNGSLDGKDNTMCLGGLKGGPKPKRHKKTKAKTPTGTRPTQNDSGNGNGTWNG